MKAIVLGTTCQLSKSLFLTDWLVPVAPSTVAWASTGLRISTCHTRRAIGTLTYNVWLRRALCSMRRSSSTRRLARRDFQPCVVWLAL